LNDIRHQEKDMNRKNSKSHSLKRLGCAVLLSSSATFIVMADGNNGHGHDNKAAHDKPAAPAHGAAGGGATHAHQEWTAPPAVYANKKSDRWADIDAIARGEKIYEQYCASCHGQNGRGTGPLAASLSHPPADLTNHFHKAPGNGDAYLFWRVSEGGVVEPFKSMGSAMLPFKSVLNEDKRWDVLAYIHAYFHLGLGRWRADADGSEKSAHQEHGEQHSEGKESDEGKGRSHEH
jgi:mono/diheme cytochrome c family protein